MSDEEADHLARKASTLAEAILLIRAQTSADVYSIGEYIAGERIRRVTFDRDVDPQWELEGEPRKWEADLLFALPRDGLSAFLSDDDSYTDADLKTAEQAHAEHNLDLAHRRLPLLAASLWKWLRTQGVDPAAPSGCI